MSFDTLQTLNPALEKVFEEAAKTFSLPSVLPHDNEALQTLLLTQQKLVQTLHQEAQAMRAQMQTIRDEAHAYVIRMLEQAALARQRMFGASSEQLSAQSRLFDEAEALAQTSTTEQDTAPIAPEEPAPAAQANTNAPATKPARGKRAPLAASLPRVDVIHDVAEEKRTCPCGTPDGGDRPRHQRTTRHRAHAGARAAPHQEALWLPRQPARPRHGGLARAAATQEQRQFGLSGHVVGRQVR